MRTYSKLAVAAAAASALALTACAPSPSDSGSTDPTTPAGGDDTTTSDTTEQEPAAEAVPVTVGMLTSSPARLRGLPARLEAGWDYDRGFRHRRLRCHLRGRRPGQPDTAVTQF